MSDSNTFGKSVLRWLGFAADFASSVFGGSPIGLTEIVPEGDKPRPTGEDDDTHGIDPDEPNATNSTGA
jgi:hypothetical protein